MKKVLYTIAAILLVLTNNYGQAAGNAISMDGIDDYMMVPHHQSLNPGDGSWTISIWIKAPDIIQRAPLITKRLPVEGYNQYSLGIADTNAHYPLPGKRIYSNYIDSAGVSERSGYVSTEFVDGNWHHIAYVADKVADSIFVYIDGIKQSFIIQYNYGTWPNVGNVDSLFIGHNNVAHFYVGEMDELSLWSKALSPSQINIVMSDTLSPAYYSTADSGLVGYWRFDEFENLGIGGGLDDIRDFSVWANHGGTEGLPLLVPSGILLDVEDKNSVLPDKYALYQNYPNPFSAGGGSAFGGNPGTKIRFTIPTVERFAESLKKSERIGNSLYNVQLKVYDVLGNEVATLINEEKPAGEYEVEFNPASSIQNPASGVYFYQLKAGSFIQTKKMILLK